MAGVVISETATLQESRAKVVIARQVQSAGTRTAILLAGKVEGSVETALDTPRALLAGLTAGVAVGLVLFVGKLLSRKR
jgi:hypothetical protein